MGPDDSWNGADVKYLLSSRLGSTSLNSRARNTFSWLWKSFKWGSSEPSLTTWRFYHPMVMAVFLDRQQLALLTDTLRPFQVSDFGISTNLAWLGHPMVLVAGGGNDSTYFLQISSTINLSQWLQCLSLKRACLHFSRTLINFTDNNQFILFKFKIQIQIIYHNRIIIFHI